MSKKYQFVQTRNPSVKLEEQCTKTKPFSKHKGRARYYCDTFNRAYGEIYKSECLEKRLLPFLQQHDEAPLFWPDLASCHYSKSVLEWYEANSVHFVPKDMNPPNCPELRPVEQYWAMMKRELRKSKKTVKDEKDMLRKWKKN